MNNSRCSEVLDSEFYYQVFPSLDLAIYDVNQDFLKLRGIKAVDTVAKPDSRYLNMLSIGFNHPMRVDASHESQLRHKNKYGCSRGVTRDEWLVVSPNKLASFGRVKSYGSVTTIMNSVALGAQGSPCFNEMGKCWGMIINSHTDIPERWSSAVSRKQNQVDEEKMLREIDRRIAADEAGKKFKKSHKKEKKEKKRDKKHKHKKEKV